MFCRSHYVKIHFHFTVFLESCSMRTLSLSRTVSNVDVVTFIVYGHRLAACYYSAQYKFYFFSALVKCVAAT
jgi:hypothetical protein